MSEPQPQFTNTVPENYHQHLVPALFQGFADSMANRLLRINPKSVLELACGTGVVTQALATRLPEQTRIVASDFSEAMLDFARKQIGGSKEIDWQIADACVLPLDDASFDGVVCQFGVMFFPDKPLAMAEALRVLNPGGHLLFNTWGAITANPIFQIVEETLTALLPEEETPFMPTPFTMSNLNEVRDLVQAAGFHQVDIAEESHWVGPHDPASLASGFAFGTPLGLYLSQQGYDLEKIHSALKSGFAAKLGDPVQCEINALFCRACKA